MAAMDITDTHCHIHQIVTSEHNDPTHEKWKNAGVTDVEAVVAGARAAGVNRLVCVGTDLADSRLAVDFVQSRPDAWASIGIHPHEAKYYVDGSGDSALLRQFAALAGQPKVVAVGECGLDYFYGHSPKAAQEKVLRFQIELALEHNLPMIFHVREAFGDFWPIFDSYSGVRGVIHSFSATRRELEAIVERGLYVGLNGIVTFTKDEAQLTAFRAVPAAKMVIETDAPYLTPTPYRGTICEPKHAATNLSFVAQLQGVSEQQLAAQTTENARRLFNLPQ